MKKFMLGVCLVALVALFLVPTTALAKSGTKLTVSLDSPWEHYDWAPTLTGVLKTSSGKALKSQTVALYCNGSKITSKKTNSSGKVTFEVRTLSGDNEDRWTLSYGGSAKYKKAKSVTKKTMVNLHYWVDYAVPAQADVDGDAELEYAYQVNLLLFEGETVAISTPIAPTVRIVTALGSPTNLYGSDVAEERGEFTAPADGTYSFTMIQANADANLAYIW